MIFLDGRHSGAAVSTGPSQQEGLGSIPGLGTESLFPLTVQRHALKVDW